MHPAHYAFTLEDFRADAFRLKPGQLRIQWDPEDSVCPATRASLGEQFRAVVTNGDGACALHSVFGAPRARELFMIGARDWAVQCLSTLPGATATDATATRALVSIHTSLWSDLAQPVLRGRSTVEGGIFWRALATTAPSLAEEARRFYAREHVAVSQQAACKVEAMHAARRFFTTAREEACI